MNTDRKKGFGTHTAEIFALCGAGERQIRLRERRATARLAIRTGFAFHSPVTRRTKKGQNEGERGRIRGMLESNGCHFITRAHTETFNEATHEKAGWNIVPCLRQHAGAFGLLAEECRPVLRVWLPVEGGSARECAAKRVGEKRRRDRGVEWRGKSAERKAAWICGVYKEFAAVASHGCGSGGACGIACRTGCREIDASSPTVSIV